uniref:Forkhead box protein O n=1 Tax=Phallusia mammillata TaxID=59560 RepID=A0A6F9DCG1_9ASCI|nr:FoxO [Phallusia mammillata]
MAEMPEIDPDFGPVSRPRSCTWPLNRPNIGGHKNDSQDSDIVMKLEATIEECGSQEQLMADANDLSNDRMVKQEPKQEAYVTMSPSSFPSADYSSVLLGSPSSNLVSNILQTPQNVSQTCSGVNDSTYTVSENINQVTSCGSLTQSSQLGAAGNKGINLDMTSAASSESSPAASATVVTKSKTSSRKNAWGNMSYADLITQGIESSPDKRLTLAQIYDWMVKNVPYFKDKGDSNSSAGWKNSIRHNLSLHSKFKRIQNEGTGKSSWWVINYDAKPGKPARRRTTSMDTSLAKGIKPRLKIAKQKAEQLKKEKALKHDGSWTKSPNADPSQDYEHLNKSFTSEFRNRTSSNASSIGGRISPTHSGFLTQDLEADGPPPLSPLSSSYTPSSKFDLFGGSRGDTFSLVDNLDHPDLLDSIAGIEMLDPSSPMTQCQSNQMSAANNDRTNIYLNTPSNIATSQVNSTSTINKAVLSSPNLASLLQGTSTSSIKSLTLNTPPLKQNVDLGGPVQRDRAHTMPLRRQPKYDLSDSMQKPLQQSLESLSQETLLSPYKASEASLSASPHNVYNSMALYPQYGELQSRTPDSNVQGNDRARLPSSTNETKTLYELLGTQANSGIKPHCLQHNGSRMSQNIQQANNFSSQMPQQPQQLVMDNHSMSLQDYGQHYPKQNAMLGMPRQESTAQQQQLDDSNLSNMNERKFPSDINIDNQDFFDPGEPLELDQMLQEMVPELAMNLGYPFQQDSGVVSGMDLDSTMDTNVPGKTTDTSEQSYSYNSQVGLGNMDGMQQQLQQQYHHQQQQQQQQQPPPQYNAQHPMFAEMNPYCGNGPNILMDAHPNGGVVMGSGTGNVGMQGNQFSQQFTQPHPNLRQQSSVGSLYRM